MEDHIVKSQKSKVARGILTLAAAGAALTLTACSAGQITQTSNQVAAVNGVEAEVGNIALRDVSIVIDDKNALAVKFTAGNVEERGENITLNSITVDGKAVSLSGSKDVLAGGSLIGDSADAIKNYQVESAKTAHLTYTATSLSGVSDVFIGGQKEVEFTFSTGSVTVNAPVVAYTTTQGGELHRDEKANLVDKETYKEGKEEAEH